MRISTTALESFRLFMQPDQEWMGEAELLATLRGEFVPTPAVRLGKAFGQVLETPDAFRVSGGYQCDGYSFDDDTMRDPLALMDRRGVFEAKATKQYGACTVVAKADQIIGAHLIEHKTTCSTFQADKYFESYQWRFMTDIFQPLKVTYHVFCLDEHKNGVVEVRGIESFCVYPYANLHQDCCELLRRFVEYVTVRGLAPLLVERQRQSEAA